MKINTMGAERFERTIKRSEEEKSQKWIAIRVHTFPEEVEKLHRKVVESHDEILELFFTEGFTTEEKDDYKSFSFNKEHAEEIKNLLKKHQDVDVVNIHCKYGVSRSTGIAEGIKYYLKKEFEKEVEINNIQEWGSVYPSFQISETFKC